MTKIEVGCIWALAKAVNYPGQRVLVVASSEEGPDILKSMLDKEKVEYVLIDKEFLFENGSVIIVKQVKEL